LIHFGLWAYSGLGSCRESNATYLWSFPQATAGVPSQPNVELSALVAIEPSPGRGTQAFTLSVATGDEPRALEIFTADGRRVWSSTLQGLGPGLQRVAWDGRTSARRPAPASVYFARLTTTRRTSTRRFVRF